MLELYSSTWVINLTKDTPELLNRLAVVTKRCKCHLPIPISWAVWGCVILVMCMFFCFCCCNIGLFSKRLASIGTEWISSKLNFWHYLRLRVYSCNDFTSSLLAQRWYYLSNVTNSSSLRYGFLCISCALFLFLNTSYAQFLIMGTSKSIYNGPIQSDSLLPPRHQMMIDDIKEWDWDSDLSISHSHEH